MELPVYEQIYDIPLPYNGLQDLVVAAILFSPIKKTSFTATYFYRRFANNKYESIYGSSFNQIRFMFASGSDLTIFQLYHNAVKPA